MCYKIYNNLVDFHFDTCTYFNVRNVRELRNVNTHHSEPKFARTDTCEHSFFYNTVKSWNRLSVCSMSNKFGIVQKQVGRILC